jgi:hypothetical protein
MAATEIDKSGEQVESTARKTRFVASPAAEQTSDGVGLAEHEEVDGALMSRRAAIGGVCMGAAAVLCFVLGAGLSGGESAVSGSTAKEVFELREQIRVAETKADALPRPEDADRALVTAQSSAGQIAQLQNDYRHLTPFVAAKGGTLDAAASESTRRNLTPYFSPEVGQPALEPWYLLASDKEVSAGTGIPMSFDCGFRWVAQRPYSIAEDSTIRVTWLAVETRPVARQTPAVLAWAHADYDMTRKTFSNVETGTTTTGEALRQEVKAQ